MAIKFQQLIRCVSHCIIFTACLENALADTPAFDRPGIVFSSAVIPAGSFAYELGLPDFQHDANNGSKSTIYSLNTNIRAGLTESAELQLATPILNYMRTKEDGASSSENGLGDSSLSLKVALPSSNINFTWAGLAGVTFATGDDAFSANKPVYRLASAANIKLSDTTSTGLYLNLTRSDGKTGFTLSPNLSFALTDTVGTYVELGYSHVDQSPNSTIAGAGFTWMVMPQNSKTQVQLDFSMDFGLNHNSPDVLGGFGVSIFTP